MAKVLSEARLTTRSARASLCPGLHWRAIDPEIHLGYRKGARGGRWVVRWYTGQQKYRQEALGVADDILNVGTLSYEAAHKAAKAVVKSARKIEATSYADTGLTVRTAIEEYMAERDRRARFAGRTAPSSRRAAGPFSHFDAVQPQGSRARC